MEVWVNNDRGYPSIYWTNSEKQKANSGDAMDIRSLESNRPFWCGWGSASSSVRMGQDGPEWTVETVRYCRSGDVDVRAAGVSIGSFLVVLVPVFQPSKRKLSSKNTFSFSSLFLPFSFPVSCFCFCSYSFDSIHTINQSINRSIQSNPIRANLTKVQL